MVTPGLRPAPFYRPSSLVRRRIVFSLAVRRHYTRRRTCPSSWLRCASRLTRTAATIFFIVAGTDVKGIHARRACDWVIEFPYCFASASPVIEQAHSLYIEAEPLIDQAMKERHRSCHLL